MIRRRKVLFLAFVMACVGLSTNYAHALEACTPAPPGLISWWPGDGDPEDIQDDNDGTLVSGAGFASGKVGQAFSFAGPNDLVEVGNPANLNLSSGITLQAWVNPSQTPSADDASLTGIFAIVTKWGQSAVTDAYGIWLRNPDGTVRLIGGIGIPLTSDGGFTGGIIPVGQWSLVSMTYDGSTGVNELYVNAQLVNSRVHFGGITQSNLNVLIGQEDSIYPRPFNGLIDEVQIYDRPLSLQEILAEYDAGSAGKCKAPINVPEFASTPIAIAVASAAYLVMSRSRKGFGRGARSNYQD